MIDKILSWMKEFIPPIALRCYREAARKDLFAGDYATWEEARQVSTGYDSDLILKKVKDSVLKVKNGEAVYERDSVLFDKIQYSWPLLAGLLWIASQKGNRLNLLDFGGSLGSTYYQNRSFLSHLKEMRWSIVEQKNFVECGKREFENEHMKFYDDLDECFREQRPDAILLSGVLQYLEKPYALLEKVGSLGFEFILLDRTSFRKKGGDRITVQGVPPEIFPASYPCWFLSLERFLDMVGMRYLLVEEFEGVEKADVKDSVFKGFIFRRK
jgi:putative methyltransferase (TIGR04325 family)